MGSFDDHVAIMGDWMPPSPSPRAFFSSVSNDDTLIRSYTSSISENKNCHYIQGAEEQDFLTEASTHLDEPKMSSRRGLMERRAARAGFNAPRLNTENIRHGDISKYQGVRSPYLTIPPGLSPTTLLDSPVFLTNSLAQPSPTTGKFLFGPSCNNRNSTLMMDDRDKFKDNTFEDATSFVFKPIPDSGSTHDFNQKNEVHASGFTPHPFPSFGISFNSDTSRLHQGIEPSKTQTLDPQAENSPSFDEPREDDLDQKSSGQVEEDGYNWRKYGQKQVKGSEYPRSYYKCTHPNCLVKKKVERSCEGHITEIIYKGPHNHPKPLTSQRSSPSLLGPPNGPSEMLPSLEPERMRMSCDGNVAWSAQEYSDNGGGSRYESGDVVEGSCTFSNDGDGDGDDDHVTHASVSAGYDGEGDESESKRRRTEIYASEITGATRAIREPRVVVQTTSEVDILDDGYRWRKYGQKVVKGNPNPRSYYKCTSPGCNVRKHVERASHDLKSVITTYEGKHNHDVPVARNSSHGHHSGPNTLTALQASAANHMHRPDPSSQMHSSLGRFNRHSLGSYGLQGRPHQMSGPGRGFGFGLNQPSFNLGLAGLGHNQGKLPATQVHPYLGQRQIQPIDDNMAFVLPKAEPKMEPVTDSTDGSSVYQQLMSRLPLGPNV